MTLQRLIGLVVLIVGIVLLVMGFNASGSMADQVTHTMSGHYTDHTTWYIIVGVVLAVIGLALALIGMGHGRHGRLT